MESYISGALPSSFVASGAEAPAFLVSKVKTLTYDLKQLVDKMLKLRLHKQKLAANPVVVNTTKARPLQISQLVDPETRSALLAEHAKLYEELATEESQLITKTVSAELDAATKLVEEFPVKATNELLELIRECLPVVSTTTNFDEFKDMVHDNMVQIPATTPLLRMLKWFRAVLQMFKDYADQRTITRQLDSHFKRLALTEKLNKKQAAMETELQLPTDVKVRQLVQQEVQKILAKQSQKKKQPATKPTATSDPEKKKKQKSTKKKQTPLVSKKPKNVTRPPHAGQRDGLFKRGGNVKRVSKRGPSTAREGTSNSKRKKNQ